MNKKKFAINLATLLVLTVAFCAISIYLFRGVDYNSIMAIFLLMLFLASLMMFVKNEIPLKRRLLWIAGSTITLFIGFLIATYILGETFGLLEFPGMLMILGSLVMLYSLFAFSKRVVISVPVGYFVGFLLSMSLGYDYYLKVVGEAFKYDDDIYNGYSNHIQIWIFTYLLIILYTIASEVVIKIHNLIKNKKNSHK